MKKRFAALLLAALLLSLSACGQRRGGAAGGPFLWFPTAEDDLTSAVSSTGYEGESTVPAMMAALLRGPGGAADGLIPFAPAGTVLLDWSVESRVARVELSAPYAELEGVERTLADYCVALTLIQISGVDGVSVAVEGQAPGRVLRAGDVVFSGAEEEPVEVPVTLYFHMVSGGLGYEVRTFRLTEDEAPAKAVLEALIAGPENKDALAPLLPEDLTVYAAWMDGGVCSVNVSSALLSEMPEAAAERELVIESMVDTLCSLDAVEQVQILVEGESVDRYGEIDLSGPLLPEARDA